MDKEKARELHEKIIAGVKQSYLDLVEEKKKTNGKLVFGIDGKVVVVNARDIEPEK